MNIKKVKKKKDYGLTTLTQLIIIIVGIALLLYITYELEENNREKGNNCIKQMQRNTNCAEEICRAIWSEADTAQRNILKNQAKACKERNGELIVVPDWKKT